MLNKTLRYFFLAGILFGAVIAYVGITQFKGNAVQEEAHIYISRQSDYKTLLDSLMPKIKHQTAFRLYANHLSLDKSFKAGHYLLRPKMSVVEIARMLKLGLETPIRLRINNVRIAPQLAQKLARQLDADSLSFIHMLTNKELAKNLGFDSLTFFSMFLPNTYEVYWTTEPEELAHRMKREYDNFWSKREAKLSRTRLSKTEVMTLASIVYEETRKVDEMPRIAGVYINRLRKGIPLQADPTIKYAMQDFSLRRILYRHLKYPSPYNTYINRGLPPSPICMPSIQAIDAVLNFEKHNYIYFCARPTFDGYHNFARTLSEHNANARAYSKELNRRKIK